MKRCILTALIVLAALLTAAALAEGGTCGEGLTWTLSSDGVLTVSGTGEMTNGEDYGTAPWDDIKTSIREIVIGDGVESVGDYMFWNCGNVTSVTLGDGVRFRHPEGVAAIVPDAHLSAVRVTAESANSEFARELCDFYQTRIEKITNWKESASLP